MFFSFGDHDLLEVIHMKLCCPKHYKVTFRVLWATDRFNQKVCHQRASENSPPTASLSPALPGEGIVGIPIMFCL